MIYYLYLHLIILDKMVINFLIRVLQTLPLQIVEIYFRHLKNWNDLYASVVKSTPLCKFKTSLSDIDLSPYLYYNRNIPSYR